MWLSYQAWCASRDSNTSMTRYPVSEAPLIWLTNPGAFGSASTTPAAHIPHHLFANEAAARSHQRKTRLATANLSMSNSPQVSHRLTCSMTCAMAHGQSRGSLPLQRDSPHHDPAVNTRRARSQFAQQRSSARASPARSHSCATRRGARDQVGDDALVADPRRSQHRWLRI